MKILVTGANGFIGKNLLLSLSEKSDVEVLPYVRNQELDYLSDLLAQADIVIHLAAENRPVDIQAFVEVNEGLTIRICEDLSALGKDIPVIFASSIQAEMNNPYGRSKLSAERALEELSKINGNPVAIYRLPGVFGKWCRPNYNSVVATFCYNKAHDLPVQVNDANSKLLLVYVDDVVNAFLNHLYIRWSGCILPVVKPEYKITVGDLSNQIDTIKNSRYTLTTEKVGLGFTRALYATFLSYLPVDKFSYDIPSYVDNRGMFVEMLKTKDSGQFSFFTSNPGVIRGNHYHHTKTEKFLVVNGFARFEFQNILNNQLVIFTAQSNHPQIIESIPGWTHKISNIGNNELVVLVWANEVFDQSRPDTITKKIE
jgi:UDP-2-acetamido-2,6-beta-L-arabino-hexul-4-ose reductase